MNRTFTVFPAYFAVLALFSLLVSPSTGLFAQSSGDEELMDGFGCNYVWKQSTFGADMGVNSIYSGDVDNDGITEMIFSANYNGWDDRTFWYVLEYDPVHSDYKQVFISPATDYGAFISVIEVLDTDNDGTPEVAVGFETGRVEIWNALNFGLEKVFYLPNEDEYWRTVKSITVADADNDGEPELLCTSGDVTFFFKWNSYQLDRVIYKGPDRLRCGNVNTDPLIEMVFSNGEVWQLKPGSNAPDQIGIISYLPGYWERLTLQLEDVDNDQMAEIVFTDGARLRVIDGDTFLSKFSYSFEDDITAVATGDVDGDGIMEVVAAEADQGTMRCFEMDGTEIWTIDNSGDAVSCITIGDLDNDGGNEMMWGTGYRVTDDDFLHVCALPGLQEEWESAVWQIPYAAVEIGDVDGDGWKELISMDSDGEYMTIFDAVTKEVEWRSPYMFTYNMNDIKLFDIDNDGATEIIICGERVKSINGITHETESSFYTENYSGYRWLEIADIDRNGTNEYIISTGYNVLVMDPTDGGILWSTYDRINEKFYDLAVGNIDDDPELEIVSNRYKELVIYDVPNHTENSVVMQDSTVSCLFDYDKDGTLDVMVCNNDGNIGYYNGQSLNYTELPFNLKPYINQLMVFYYPRSSNPTFVFVHEGKVGFSDNTGHFSPDQVIGDRSADEMDLTDYNSDGTPELFVLADGMITEIDLTCYLPVALPENTGTRNINVYPNPTSGITVVELPSGYSGRSAEGSLYTLQGMEVRSFAVEGGRCVFDCKGLAKGIYLLKVEETVTKVIVN